MKRTSQTKNKARRTDGLKAEYRFDYSKAKPNRFAGRVPPGAVAILLDPDVARVFKNADSVNAILRAVLTNLPARQVRRSG
jgi:hypothetical protein